MRTILFICMIDFILCVSCNQILRGGQGIIDQNKMATLLNEMALAEGFAESYLFRDTSKSRDSIIQHELDKALLINHVTAEQFAASYRYYKSKPEIFKVIVDSANAMASRNRELIYTRRKINAQ
jgi:hypothetical protein